MRAFDSNNHLQNNSLGQRFSSTDLAQVKSHYNEICYFINKKASRSKPFAALHIEPFAALHIEPIAALHINRRGYAFAATGGGLRLVQRAHTERPVGIPSGDKIANEMSRCVTSPFASLTAPIPPMAGDGRIIGDGS
jgi:hypothetical protein